jgi:hypothetical protein
MSNWLMIIIVSLFLGVAFTGASYFVTREEDVVFTCRTDTNAASSPQYNTYQKTETGFPFAFYTKYSAPKSVGCQAPASDGALSPLISDDGVNYKAYSVTDKINFIKDAAIYSAVFFVVGALLFGARKKQA